MVTTQLSVTQGEIEPVSNPGFRTSSRESLACPRAFISVKPAGRVSTTQPPVITCAAGRSPTANASKNGSFNICTSLQSPDYTTAMAAVNGDAD